MGGSLTPPVMPQNPLDLAGGLGVPPMNPNAIAPKPSAGTGTPGAPFDLGFLGNMGTTGMGPPPTTGILDQPAPLGGPSGFGGAPRKKPMNMQKMMMMINI